MPTVMRLGGLRVVIYPNDHDPEHVHVIGADSEAVFMLNCPSGPVELRRNFGFAMTRLRQIARALDKNLPELCVAWRQWHG